jgi:hypothetical protein
LYLFVALGARQRVLLKVNRMMVKPIAFNQLFGGAGWTDHRRKYIPFRRVVNSQGSFHAAV